MTDSTESQQADATPKGVDLRTFFEQHPPGQLSAVVEDKLFKYVGNHGQKPVYSIKFPRLLLHCETDTCSGEREFEITSGESHTFYKASAEDVFVDYTCRNCGRYTKTYALRVNMVLQESGLFYKFGEVPDFGPPIPSKVSSLLGQKRDYFFKGRRSENQGLGIAAFAYYRRVVQDQKDRIFDEIIKVAEKMGSETELVAELRAAKAETQFTNAVEAVKRGLPQVLLIDGHNPLTLLHAALSDGLHDRTDAECLDLANTVRVVLYDLVDRAATALRANEELRTAVSRLTKKGGGGA